MTMYPILNLPETPRWATDVSATDEPPEANKDTGAVQGTASPAKWFNWLQNTNYQWTQVITRTALMNWNENALLGGVGDTELALYHPDLGLWVTADDNSDTYKSPDGYNWTIGANLVANTRYRCGGIDTSYFIVGATDDSLSYSADLLSWTNITSATIGGSGGLGAFATKYPDSDFAMVTRGNSTVRIASSGITGSWADPSIQPPTPPTGIPDALIYTGGSTWLLSVNGTNDNRIYRSTDDGDTWAETSPGVGPLFALGSTGMYHMAYSRDSDRLVITGTRDASISKKYIAYSDDLGDTWTDATIDKYAIGGDFERGDIEGVYYCGGGAWVARGKYINNDRQVGVHVSTDNGVTWFNADLNDAAVPSLANLSVMACNGQKLIIFGDNRFNMDSLAI